MAVASASMVAVSASMAAAFNIDVSGFRIDSGGCLQESVMVTQISKNIGNYYDIDP